MTIIWFNHFCFYFYLYHSYYSCAPHRLIIILLFNVFVFIFHSIYFRHISSISRSRTQIMQETSCPYPPTSYPVRQGTKYICSRKLPWSTSSLDHILSDPSEIFLFIVSPILFLRPPLFVFVSCFTRMVLLLMFCFFFSVFFLFLFSLSLFLFPFPSFSSFLVASVSVFHVLEYLFVITAGLWLPGYQLMYDIQRINWPISQANSLWSHSCTLFEGKRFAVEETKCLAGFCFHKSPL